MKKKNVVYIIGHRNPDTDSICSAIAYADVKNRTAEGSFVPMRAGQINEETEFVLNYFHTEVPAYLPDAAARVGEIDIHEIPGANRQISVKQAWERMKQENVVTLPVTTEDNRLEGLITVRDIAQSYMDVHDNDVLSQACTQYRSIAETLDGQVVVGDETQFFDTGRVIIGAFHPDMMGNYIQEKDLVIVGNRAEDQLCCLDLKASCIVVGLGAPISASIQRLARDSGCVIISSPHDTYTIARLINQAIPISHLMVREGLITFQTTDRATDIEEIMKISRHRDYPVLTQRGRYIGTISRRNLIGRSGKRLILVDHNEKSQAVPNIEEAEILEIIDHHRLGSLETIAPILFRNQPVGCTGTIIYQIYQEHMLDIPPQIAGLLCSAIISDTLLFRSPTCTPADRDAAEKLAVIAGLEDLQKYAMAMFHAGSNLEDKSADEIFRQDFKKFMLERVTFGVGQISSMDAEELSLIRAKILPQMKRESEKPDTQMVFFMLTNIIEEKTELLFCGDRAEELAADAFGVETGENSCQLPGIISRKKQLIPAFLTALQQWG